MVCTTHKNGTVNLWMVYYCFPNVTVSYVSKHASKFTWVYVRYIELVALVFIHKPQIHMKVTRQTRQEIKQLSQTDRNLQVAKATTRS